jgi:hypothetical protein
MLEYKKTTGEATVWKECCDPKELELGMRVRSKQEGEGVVCDISSYKASIGVRFDGYKTPRHDCDGHCENHHGWYVVYYTLEIQTNGTQTTLMEVTQHA